MLIPTAGQQLQLKTTFARHVIYLALATAGMERVNLTFFPQFSKGKDVL